jgi:hypothetical protein
MPLNLLVDLKYAAYPNTHMKRSFVAVFLCLLLATSVEAGFNGAQAAYRRGGYADQISHC